MYIIPLSIPTEKKEYQITYQTPFDDVKIPDGKTVPQLKTPLLKMAGIWQKIRKEFLMDILE